MRLKPGAFGVACGLTLGVAGFLGTIFSLWFGQGATIGMLAAAYIGYSWSFFGAIVALFWGLIYGFIGGWFLAVIYNGLASRASEVGPGS